jgi:hypothetical protein
MFQLNDVQSRELYRLKEDRIKYIYWALVTFNALLSLLNFGSHILKFYHKEDLHEPFRTLD